MKLMGKRLLALAALASLAGCHVRHGGGDGVGEYVYVDWQRTVHTDRECEGVAVSRKARPLRVIAADSLGRGDWYFTCAECVGDSAYAYIVGKCDSNEADAKRRRLRGDLVGEGH